MKSRRMSRRALVGGAAAATLAPRTYAFVSAQENPTWQEEPVRWPNVILPHARLLSFYGFPGVPQMGILGAQTPEELYPQLLDQALAYEDADPSKPVVMAYEVIASVAQRDPGSDGSYIGRISDDVLQEYVDFCQKRKLHLLLDMQYGRLTTEQELEAIAPWLEYPFVHPALDPEFSVEEGETPGVELGSIDGSDVTFAQQWVADFCATRGLPPKILIVHQFNFYSISNKETIGPVDGVQFCLEVDGFGTPAMKLETYEVLTQDPIEFHGFKLWYSGEDDPMMTEEEVINLDPSPDVIIYQ
jgi:hypothetical protein